MWTRTMLVAAVCWIGSHAIPSSALAAFIKIQDSPILINGTNGNKADFGAGGHSGGFPQNSGNVKWEYDNENACLVAKATVTGKVYLDDFFGGTVRVTIFYMDENSTVLPNGQVTLVSSTMPFSAIGAADSTHQMAVNHNFQHARLSKVMLTTAYAGKSSSGSARVSDKQFRFRSLTSPGFVGFGASGYTCTASGCTGPNGDAVVTFSRISNGTEVLGRVQGRMYWLNEQPGVARLRVEWLRRNGTVLFTDPDIDFNPAGGSNPNHSSNQWGVSDLFTRHIDCRLWMVRLRLGRVVNGQFIDQSLITIPYQSGQSVGAFEFTPSDISMASGSRATMAFKWTVPDPMTWPDLHSLQLRVRNGDETLVSVFFDEASRTFAVLDEDSGKLSQAYAAGSNKQLTTSKAVLHLRDTRLQTTGPDDPSVTLHVSLSFKASASGDRYTIEVAATDDEGQHGPFETAGMVTVQ